MFSRFPSTYIYFIDSCAYGLNIAGCNHCTIGVRFFSPDNQCDILTFSMDKKKIIVFNLS